MTLRWTLPAVLAALACAACDKPHEPHPDVKSVPQVLLAYKSFEEAWEKEDLEAAAGMFLPNAVVFDPVPPGRFEKTEAIRGWIAGSFDGLDDISIETSNLKLQVAGPTAWITAHYVFSATLGGKPARFEGDMTINWLRMEDGAWKVAVFHASHLPPPAPAETPANPQ